MMYTTHKIKILSENKNSRCDDMIYIRTYILQTSFHDREYWRLYKEKQFEIRYFVLQYLEKKLILYKKYRYRFELIEKYLILKN